MTTNLIRDDFDRLALLEGDDHVWSHNNHYHPFLLSQLPTHCEDSLEIGCGSGSFARLLAQRSDHVLALDLSPQMIQVARSHSAQLPNIEFLVTDVLEWEFPAERYDCIASIATFHHLPLEIMLAKMKMALKPGGVLAILDLRCRDNLFDLPFDALALLASASLKLVKGGRSRSTRAVQEAWAEHGKRDHYLTVSAVRRMCRDLLPGAAVRKHLFWRYSIIWKKPVSS